MLCPIEALFIISNVKRIKLFLRHSLLFLSLVLSPRHLLLLFQLFLLMNLTDCSGRENVRGEGNVRIPLHTVPRQFVYGDFVYDTSSTDISSTDISSTGISSIDISSTTVYQRVGQLYIQFLFQQIIIFINSNFYLHYDSFLSIPLPLTL